MAKTVRKSYKITFDVTVQVQDNVTEEMVRNRFRPGSTVYVAEVIPYLRDNRVRKNSSTTILI